MNIIQMIAGEFNVKESQVENTVALIDEGNTIPFIARYRKEVTGGLSDEVLRDISGMGLLPLKTEFAGEKRRGHQAHRRAGKAE